MKDFEDFDDYNNDDSPRSRVMSWVVLVIALSGFVALAWYAYRSGSQSVQEGQLVVIKADDTPIKVKPKNAGGAQFPHKDKTIYDTISPYRTDGGSKVEKLLPEPEEPIAVDISKEPSTATRTWVNDNLRRVSDAEEKINAQLKEAEAKKNDVKEPVVVEAAKEEAPKVAAPVTVAKEEATQAIAAPVTEVKQDQKPVAAATPAAPVTAPAPMPAAATGGHMVQLGAFGSEAEARQNWTRISTRHATILNGYSHVVVRADIPGKGTFYRLRATGFASEAAAKQACTRLSAAGQGCFYAGK